MAATPAIWTFFYGSYMNLDVLKEVNITPTEWQKAHLPGFDIIIQPRANVIPADKGTVYGIAARTTHDELDRLYSRAKDVLGEIYLPEAVLVENDSGNSLPALCYICHDMAPQPATNDYIDRIVEPARAYGFPDWYIQKLESFRP